MKVGEKIFMMLNRFSIMLFDYHPAIRKELCKIVLEPTCMKLVGEWMRFSNLPWKFCHGNQIIQWKIKMFINKATVANHVLECEGGLIISIVYFIPLFEISLALIVCSRCDDSSISSLSRLSPYRISQAVDTCSECYDEESITYDTTASSEEERTLMMCNALFADADSRGVSLDNVDCQHEDDAIHQ